MRSSANHAGFFGRQQLQFEQMKSPASRSSLHSVKWILENRTSISKPVCFHQLRKGYAALQYSRQFGTDSEGSLRQSQEQKRENNSNPEVQGLDPMGCDCSRLRCLTRARQRTRSYHIRHSDVETSLPILHMAVLFLAFCSPLLFPCSGYTDILHINSLYYILPQNKTGHNFIIMLFYPAL